MEDTPTYATTPHLTMMALANTPQRVERIKNFEIQIRLATIEGVSEPIIYFSEPIVAPKVQMDHFYNYTLNQIVDGMEMLNRPLIEKRLTSFVTSLLFNCHAFFEDETDDYTDQDLYSAYEEKSNDMSKLTLE
jgi:hypothetical protein